jgi:hypothetical protein
MIELAPDLMAALQAEADRQGKTVSEIASDAVHAWIVPLDFGDADDAPVEPPRRVVLPIEGATYTSEAGPIRVKAVEPLWEPEQPIYQVTVEFLSEQDGEEWEEHQIYGEDWMDLMEKFGLTLESPSDAGFTRVCED